MINKPIYTTIVATSFLIAVALGMSDYETKSLVHLFTAEWGNIFMLTLLTTVFSAVGIAVCNGLQYFKKSKLKNSKSK